MGFGLGLAVGFPHHDVVEQDGQWAQPFVGAGCAFSAEVFECSVWIHGQVAVSDGVVLCYGSTIHMFSWVGIRFD